MSRTKIASHYYNLGRQQAARDLLGGLTKTAAPSSRELRQLAALGGAGLLGAGIANSKAIGGGIDAAISRAAGAGRAVTDPATYLAMLNEAQAALQGALIQGNIKGSQGLDAIVSALNTAGSKLRGIDPQQFRSEFIGASRLPRGAVESFEQGLSEVPVFYRDLMGKGEGRKALESFLAD